MTFQPVALRPMILRRAARLLLLAPAMMATGCSEPRPGGESPRPVEPILIGVRTGGDTATVFAEGPGRLVRPATSREKSRPGEGDRRQTPAPDGDTRAEGNREERTLARVGAFQPVYLGLAGGGVTAWGPWGELSRSPRRVRLVPEDPEDHVFIAGRPYRGEVEAIRLPDGTLTVANRVALEPYLVSVISSELGDEGLAAAEAGRAQAVAARSYAVLFGLRRRIRDSLGVDLLADPAADQSYPGVLVEREAGRRAVRETRGLVLTWGGRLAEAYYHSTCGGRTARPAEVWPAENRPYLRSIVDAPADVPEDVPAEEEADFCSISPRYRWSRAWTATELDEAVRPALARATGRDPESLGAIREIAVTGRSGGGRVTELTVRTDDPPDTLRIESRRIPAALPTDGGEPLPSTWFEFVEPPEEGGLALEGRGAGHGVGMCQWGAVARARAGASWREILATYYPDTQIEMLADLERRKENP